VAVSTVFFEHSLFDLIGRSGLQFWETLPAGAELRLQVSPGLFFGEQTYLEVTDLTVRDSLNVETEMQEASALLPDPSYDVITSTDEARNTFVRSWDWGGREVLAHLEVEATITLRVVDEESWF